MTTEHEVSTKPTKLDDNRYVTFNARKLIIILVVIALPLLGFWAGIAYQKSKAPVANAQAGQFGGTSGRFGGMRRGGGTLGQVTAVSSTSITVTSQFNNASKTYSVASSTTVTNNGQSASISDIKTGDTVLIRTSGSGSTAASTIEINPSFGPPGDSSTMSQ